MRHSLPTKDVFKLERLVPVRLTVKGTAAVNSQLQPDEKITSIIGLVRMIQMTVIYLYVLVKVVKRHISNC